MPRLPRDRRKDRVLGAPGITPGQSLQIQITAHIRELILSGALQSGARLPGRRTLSRDLDVSATTILNVVQRLTSEGLVEARGGSGTYVAATPFRAARRPLPVADEQKVLPLSIGTPALELFPRKIWSRLQAQRWDRLSARALGEGHPAGWCGLREQIAQRVATLRGVRCVPEQVIVTAGAQSALALIARCVAREGESAWIEDPGYLRSSKTLLHAGLMPAPVPVDAEGFDVARARACVSARLAVVTPTRQFPTGVVMSERRRQALVRWARTESGWIVEDDFESDFCFEGRAGKTLTADAPDRVIYLSSFSPVLFPALRIGFVVVPEALIDHVLAVRAGSDRMVNTPLQMVLHDFIEAGHLSAHVRRCTTIYAERRGALNDALKRTAASADEIFAPRTGLHTILWLGAGSDRRISDAARDLGAIAGAMSQQARLSPVRSGLVLGFAAHTPEQIRRAVERIAEARSRCENSDQAN